jgi:hypothetical protein
MRQPLLLLCFLVPFTCKAAETAASGASPTSPSTAATAITAPRPQFKRTVEVIQRLKEQAALEREIARFLGISATDQQKWVDKRIADYEAGQKKVAGLDRLIQARKDELAKLKTEGDYWKAVRKAEKASADAAKSIPKAMKPGDLAKLKLGKDVAKLAKDVFDAEAEMVDAIADIERRAEVESEIQSLTQQQKSLEKSQADSLLALMLTKLQVDASVQADKKLAEVFKQRSANTTSLLPKVQKSAQREAQSSGRDRDGGGSPFHDRDRGAGGSGGPGSGGSSSGSGGKDDAPGSMTVSPIDRDTGRQGPATSDGKTEPITGKNPGNK